MTPAGLSLVEIAAQVFVAALFATTMVRLALGRWKHRKGYVLAVWLLPLSQAAAVMLILHVVFARGLAWYVPPIVLGVSVLCAVGDVLLLRGLDVAVEKDRADEQARLLEEQVALQQSYYEALETESAKAEAMRAEFAEHLARVRDAIERRQREAALGAVDGAAAVLVPAVQRYCGHRVVDALLVGKEGELKEAGVSFTCAVAVPDDGEFSDLELCAVFSNMLSNAAHACAELPEGRRWVDLKARVVQGSLVVRCENSCAPGAKGLRADAPARFKSLDDAHGWGLGILQLVARDHGGSFSAERRGDRFVAEMVLPASAP